MIYSNNITIKNKYSRNKNKHNNYIETENTNDIEDFIKDSLNELILINDEEDEELDYYNEKNAKNKKFDFKIYNNKDMFKYLNRIYLIYDNNSCWIDCFIILYIYVYKFSIIKLIDNNVELNNIDFILNLNEFTQYIIQADRSISLKFFNLYEKYSQNYNNNFLLIDKNIIGSFNPIDLAYKIFEDNTFFCIKCTENRTCTRNCILSYGSSGTHYCSPILSIPINIINDKNYNNPMNYIF